MYTSGVHFKGALHLGSIRVAHSFHSGTGIDPLFQRHGHSVARLSPDCSTDIRLHRQHVQAVAHGHKRSSEWMTVDLAADLDQTPRPKNVTDSGQTTCVQPLAR